MRSASWKSEKGNKWWQQGQGLTVVLLSIEWMFTRNRVVLSADSTVYMCINICLKCYWGLALWFDCSWMILTSFDGHIFFLVFFLPEKALHSICLSGWNSCFYMARTLAYAAFQASLFCKFLNITKKHSEGHKATQGIMGRFFSAVLSSYYFLHSTAHIDSKHL